MRRRQERVRTPAATPRLAGASAPVVFEQPWQVLTLSLLSWVLSLPLFAPWSIWPLGYIVFVPWLLAVCGARSTAWTIAGSYLLGAAFFLTHWRWLYSTTPPGYFAGALWFALHFPLCGWIVRHLVRRRRVNAAVAFAFVWVLTELMRSRGPLAFPWFLLGHSQIRLLPLVQIADITGVYGVSLLVALVNGWLCDMLLGRLGARAPEPLRVPMLHASIGIVLLFAATLIYGRQRMDGEAVEKGPRVSVLQGDFELSPVSDPNAPKDSDKRQTYLKMMAAAAADSPDLIVLPETPWGLYLNRELREFPSNAAIVHESRRQHAAIQKLASAFGSDVVIGSISLEPQPEGSYPDTHRYNSAFVYHPDGSEPGRYDKIHLVLFGEYVPFRYWYGLHWFYRWLNSITPWGHDGFEYSLTAGREFDVFATRPRAGGQERHFGITICYEDVIPQVFRQFITDAAGGKRVDFMLNISNDGWFGHGSQQPQHLVNCAFRAIENRVGIARAVNTGVSGFIAPDGGWYDIITPQPGRPLAGGEGHRSSTILIDPRVTFYSRHGDLFGAACSLVGLAGLADAIATGVRNRPKRRKRKE